MSTATTTASVSDARRALAVVQDKKAPLDNRVDSIRTLLLSAKDKIGRGIAGLLTPERAIQVACNSIRKNPQILECTPASLFGAISEAATYGWVCDGVMGQASLVPFRNNKKGCMEVTLIPGYKGLRDLVRRSGQVDISMESVHDGDTYEYRGRFELPIHKYSQDPERRFKAVTHAYVVGRFRGGNVVTFSWSVGECLAHRDRYCQSWRRVKDDKVKAAESPWHQDNPAFRVMCMKTVLLDAIHRGEFPLSVEEREVAMRETTIQQVESATIDADSWLEAEPKSAIEDAREQPRQDTQEAPRETIEANALQDALERFNACQDLSGVKAVQKELESRNNQESWLATIAGMADDARDRIRASRGLRSNGK